MSVRVKVTDLNDSQVELIKNLLILQPVDKEAEERKRWKNAPPVHAMPKAPVPMYRTDEKEHIYLPFRFACSLFGKVMNRDREFPSVNYKFSTVLREYQVESALEAKQQFDIFGSTTLGLYPGFGKTMLGAWLGHFTGGVILVFTHLVKVAQAWVKTFKTAFPELENGIWFVGEQPEPTFGVDFEYEGVIYQVPPLIICMDERIGYIPLPFKKAVKCLIIDEAHCFCTPSRIEPMLSIEPQYVIAETATLERDDGMHAMIHTIAGTHGVFKVSKTPYYVMKLNTQISVGEKRTTRGVDSIELYKSLSQHEYRNKIACDIVAKNPHRKFIIMTKLATHVSILRDMLTEAGIKCDTLFRNKNEYSDSQVLIGTVPKMGTGFDEENACSNFQGRKSDTMILMHSIKKRQAYEQVRGRVMRCATPIVIYFVDGNRMIKNHFNALSSWLKETNAIVVEQTYVPGQIILPES